MTDKMKEFCLNVFERVGTDLNRCELSNNVGMPVLLKIIDSSQFGWISVFVGTVGTVGQEKGVPEKMEVNYGN